VGGGYCILKIQIKGDIICVLKDLRYGSSLLWERIIGRRILQREEERFQKVFEPIDYPDRISCKILSKTTQKELEKIWAELKGMVKKQSTILGTRTGRLSFNKEDKY
jgi:hypothetical protein